MVVTAEDLPWTGRQVFNEVSRHEQTQMDRGAAAFADAMITIRIGHVVEAFA
jgi:hypothetical protein